jgi:hypothetical protein
METHGDAWRFVEIGRDTLRYIGETGGRSWEAEAGTAVYETGERSED